jgi:hypothetical protein
MMVTGCSTFFFAFCLAAAEQTAGHDVTFGVPAFLGGQNKGRRDPALFSLPHSSDEWQKANVLCTGVDNGTLTIMESPDGGVHWHRASAAISSAGSGAWASIGSTYAIEQGYQQNASSGPWISTKRHTFSVVNKSILMTTNISAHSTWSKTPGTRT